MAQPTGRAGAVANPDRIIYVDDNAAGANDGASWMDAYRHLQDALAEANASAKPVEIRVAQGVYRPDRGAGFTPGDREATFRLLDDVALQGGYAGAHDVDPDLRNIQRFETILSGDLNGDDESVGTDDFAASVLQTGVGRSDNSCSVVTALEVGETAVLDGFTITGGDSYHGFSPMRFGVGGGMQIRRASPLLRDCTFRFNVGYEGGGLSSDDGSATLVRCHFDRNFAARDGGGLWHELGAPTISACTFTENYALDDAGGVYLSLEGRPTLEDCRIENNVAEDDGGGIYCSQKCAPLIRRNQIVGNLASNGGGLGCKKEPAPTISDNLFRANGAWRNGGGLYLRYATCSVTGNQIKENYAGDDGGGIFLKTDEYYLDRVADSTFKDNRIIANTACDNGGGFYGKDVSPQIANCVIALNTAPNGAGLWCTTAARREATLALRNVTIFGNAGAMRGGAVCCLGRMTMTMTDSIVWANATSSYSPIVPWDYPTMVIQSSCIEGGWPGDGNIASDPCFTSPGVRDDNGTPLNLSDDLYVEGDYHLMSTAGRWNPVDRVWMNDAVTSPCIDAGDPASPVGPEPFPNGGRIDMGAYGGTREASKSPTGLHRASDGDAGTGDDPNLMAPGPIRPIPPANAPTRAAQHGRSQASEAIR